MVIIIIAKNVQCSSNGLNYVPVLVWSDSSDWTSYTGANTIIWPGNSLISPTGYAALSGVTLRIAVIESAPFTMITNNHRCFWTKYNKINWLYT